MSWELASCLKHCGLEERWLKILKNTEIETVETLVTRINDGDLYDVLESAAEDEEKEALMLLTSQEVVDHIEKRRAFRKYLEDSGLDPSLLTKTFADEGILTLEQFHSIRGSFEEFLKLTKEMNNVETFAVEEMLNIPPEVVAEHEFKCILDKIGLDSKYWFSVFKDQLGIVHHLLLEYVSSLDCRILQTHARHENELSVIKEQFLKDSDEVSCEILQNDREISCKYFMGLQKNLEELKVLLADCPGDTGSQINKESCERKKTPHDLEVRLKEEIIRILLHLPRIEVIKLGANNAGILEMFEQRIKELGQKNSFTADTLDQLVPEEASDGLMLKGMYFVTNNEEKLVPRKKVLVSPPDIHLSQPLMHHCNITELFTSKNLQECFSKSLKTNGYSLAVAERIENSAQYKVKLGTQKENVNKENGEHVLLKHIILPVASCYMDISKLCLSETAFSKLKEIEAGKEVSRDQQFEKCWEFFSEYGTHINVGLIHFGGICELKVHYDGNVQVNQEILNGMAPNLMEEFMEIDWKHFRSGTFSAKDLKDSFKEKYDKFDFENLHLSVECTGGPQSASSFFGWKLGLVGDNSSWAVLDRGFQAKGIWEILEHHQCQFSDYKFLSGILCSAWETKSGLKAGQLPNYRFIVEVPQQVTELCSSIESFLADPVFPKHCEQYLDYIQNAKDELTLASRCSHVWHSAVKDNMCITNFLNLVVQNMNVYTERNLPSINFLFLQLVKEIESMDFICKEPFTKWKSSNASLSRKHFPESMGVLLHFMSVLKTFVIPRLNADKKSKSKDVQSLIDGHCISITNDLAVFVSKVLDKLHCLGEHHLEYLLTLLLFDIGYDINSKGFYIWLSHENITRFLENFDEKKKWYIKYRKQSVSKAECYLLHIALEVSKSKNSSNIFHEVSQFMEQMKVNLGAQVNQVIDQYWSTPSQWEKIESFVQSVLSGATQEYESNNLLGTGLEKVLQISSDLPETCEIPTLHITASSDIACHRENIGRDCSILEMLGLTNYYPAKITLQQVMQVPPDKLDNLHDIPWYVLQKLLMLDYRGRNLNTLPSDFNQERNVDDENNESDYVDDDFLNDIYASFISVEEVSNTLMPHPLDVLVAIFLCSSNFLRQVLAEKMYMCHVSIPILLPDSESSKLTYLLWALRTVICEYELADGTVVETPIVNHIMPIVTFIRIGNVPRSKSKLLNDIISNQGHNTFFHRDCASGIMCPKLSNGLADVAWFLPAKQVKSKLNEAVTYINLHGNGNCLPAQCIFLRNASDVVVVLTCVGELGNPDTISFVKDAVTDNKKIVLVISKSAGSPSENFKLLFSKCLKEVGQGLKKQTIIFDFNSTGQKNTSELSSEVINAIVSALTHEERSSLLEIKKCAEKVNIIIDENDAECSSGHVLATEVFSHVDSNNLGAVKAEMLPLQGDLWHKWGRLEKKEHRQEGRELSEHFVARLHEERKALRRKQLLICSNPPRLLESFISKLLHLQGSLKLYFFKWLTIYLDGTSRKALPSIIKEYRVKWTEINQYKSKKKNENDPYMMALQDELCKIEENLAMTSLGLEHFMREIGQAYEAAASLPEQVAHGVRDNIHKLPRVMAELMVSGHPLEIMDGDAAHVPLLWVTAVLSELKLLIGDKKVFVLSVLGVQSSGKSTLLNTMFGLQFAVSAGRCTRGVYAQLVPFCKGDLNILCDYILVVDTEGLRAPELGTTKHQHDNELATLVIGLGDMTIINIKGENPTEMQDVLQIVVHALLRMQLVNKNFMLQPSCYFVHQNVGAVNAAGKMMFGQQKLQENLDKMTVAAADQENARGICSFKEVIDFNVEKNVWYFSDLWQGDPPMAPANPGYSEKVSEVKKTLINEIMQMKMPKNLSSICIRLKDLWKGILAENFVFSFKNSLELRAYGSLESVLMDLSWSLENDALKWSNTVQNRIMSSESGLDALETNLSCEFSTYFVEAYDEAEKKLSEFFEKSDDKDILEQWREKSFLKLKTKKDEIFRATMTSLKNETEKRKEEIHQISKTVTYKVEVENLATTLVMELQDQENISEKELEKKFHQMWRAWMKSSLPKQDGQISCDIERTVRSILFERLHVPGTMLENELKKIGLGVPVKKMQGNFRVSKDHIDVNSWLIFLKAASYEKCSQLTYELLKNLFDDIEKYINSLQGSKFSPTQAGRVIKKTYEMIEEVNRKSDWPFKFTAEFIVQLEVFVSRYAVFKFKTLQHSYLRETDPKRVIEKKYKGRLLKLLKSKYKKSKNEKVAADMLSSCLMEAVEKAVLGDMPRELADDVRHNVPSLHTKGDLLNSVLRDLLKKKCFEEYLLYLTNIAECLRKWIQIYTDDYVFSKKESGLTRYAELASLKLHTYFHEISLEIEKAGEKVHPEPVEKQEDIPEKTDFQVWLKQFHEGVTGKLPLPESDLSLVIAEQVVDLDFFKESLMKNLTQAKTVLKGRAESFNKKQLQSPKNSVYSLLEKQCLGCCEQCPFCQAPCSLTISGHDVEHSAMQHYPQGAGKYRWENNNKLVIDTCFSSVGSETCFRNDDTHGRYHPYKKYKELYPKWNIQADASMEASLYWKWFMANFANRLASAYDASVPDIPHAWTLITPSEAEASLG